ncbi:hypothetical protein QJS04_geneDACA017946 [Acorus gramineus]|uniref:Uncharacterized protein n=1 Tax=Acorus gramineus TaxID=55184 RepID=A0AAV9A738_ACOGR|nr:hypothetical protein QJS04_geneDACA017946 [Acorus gramineus]
MRKFFSTTTKIVHCVDLSVGWSFACQPQPCFQQRLRGKSPATKRKPSGEAEKMDPIDPNPDCYFLPLQLGEPDRGCTLNTNPDCDHASQKNLPTLSSLVIRSAQRNASSDPRSILGANQQPNDVEAHNRIDKAEL